MRRIVTMIELMALVVALAIHWPSLAFGQDPSSVLAQTLELKAAGEAAGQAVGIANELGRILAEATNGVTSLKVVVNHTSHQVILWKVDKKLFSPDTEAFVIDPNQTKEAGMWLPWADTAQAWNDHHALIKVDGEILACIWQPHGKVKMSKSEAFVEGAVEVPGLSKGGGDRVLHILSVKDKEGKESISFLITRK
jgi:hypothetical protein